MGTDLPDQRQNLSMEKFFLRLRQEKLSFHVILQVCRKFPWEKIFTPKIENELEQKSLTDPPLLKKCIATLLQITVIGT